MKRDWAMAIAWALLGVACVTLSQVYAVRSDYSLKTIGDNLVIYASVRELSVNPFDAGSELFVGGAPLNHYGPYMVGLGLLHRWSGTQDDVGAIANELAVVGVVLAGALLLSMYCMATAFVRPRTALVATSVLPLVGGPFLIIWAGDLSFHGLAYAGFFPQTAAFVGLFLAVGALVRHARSGSIPWLVGGLAALLFTFMSHGLTALLAATLVGAVARLCAPLRRGRALVGFALGGMLLAMLLPGDLQGFVGLPVGLVLLAFPFIGYIAGVFTERVLARVVATRSGDDERPLRILLWAPFWLLAIYVASTLDHTYLDQADIPIWLFLIGTVSLGLLNLRSPFLAAWAWGGVLLFATGVVFRILIGDYFPLYWRLVFFAIPPLSILFADALARAAGKVQLTAFVVTLLLAASQMAAATAPGTLDQGGLHTGLAVGEVLPGDGGTILSDPHTSAFIVGTAWHKVVTHRSDLVLPDDRPLNREGFRLFQGVVGAHDLALLNGSVAQRFQVEYVLVNINIRVGDSIDFYSYWNTTVDGDFFTTTEERQRNLELVRLLQRQYPLVAQEGPYYVFDV